MSDKVMGSTFIGLMLIIYAGAAFTVYSLGGELWNGVGMVVFLYLWTGLLIWVVCLPDSGEWKFFAGLFFGWLPWLILLIFRRNK